MRRRVLLAAGTAMIGVTGCLGADAPRSASVDEFRTRFGVDDERRYGDVVLELIAIWVYPDVRYEDFDDATFGTWDPGPDEAVVLAGWRVDNRSDRSLAYPAWDQFVLVAPDERNGPIQEFSNGVPVAGLRDQAPVGTDIDGVDPGAVREFMLVFESSMHVPSAYVLEWTYPDEPISFGP